jgi:hypothetical protein
MLLRKSNIMYITSIPQSDIRPIISIQGSSNEYQRVEILPAAVAEAVAERLILICRSERINTTPGPI